MARLITQKMVDAGLGIYLARDDGPDGVQTSGDVVRDIFGAMDRADLVFETEATGGGGGKYPAVAAGGEPVAAALAAGYIKVRCMADGTYADLWQAVEHGAVGAYFDGTGKPAEPPEVHEMMVLDATIRPAIGEDA